MKGEEMQSLRKAAQQALESIELHLQWHESGCVYLEPAVTALRDALAEEAMQRLTDEQQEMEATINKMETVEPVAWLIESYDIYAKRTLQRLVFDNPKNMQGVKITAYYTAPPKREPLTDEDIDVLRKGEQRLNFVTLREFRVIARAIERAHGIGGEE